MTNTAPATINPNRCSTQVEMKRADRLALNDMILLPKWHGTVEVVRVELIQIIGDDVEINGTTTTSIGNVFNVVTVLDRPAVDTLGSFC